MRKPLTLLTTLIALSCSFALSQERSQRQVKPFHSIEVSSGIDLYLRQSDTTNIEVDCSLEYINRIETKTEDSTLIIKAIQPMRWGYDKSPKVYVSFNELRSLLATNGADVYGSGVPLLKTLSLAAHNGADIYFTLECNTLKINASGGSDIKVSGKAYSLKANIASGSDLNAAELKSEHCDIVTSGGSDAIVNVSISLVADCNGGSDIGYIGDPSIKQLVETGGSDIYRK